MKTGVISANYKLSGNVPVSKESLKSFCNILAVAYSDAVHGNIQAAAKIICI